MNHCISHRVLLDTAEPEDLGFRKYLKSSGIESHFTGGPNGMEYEYVGSASALTDMIVQLFSDGPADRDDLECIEPTPYCELRDAIYQHFDDEVGRCMQEPIWSLDLYLPLNNAPGTSFADLANALRIDFEYFEDSHQLWLSSLIAPNIVALIASQHMPIEWRFAD